ncbi:hypothetical protein FRC02_003747 [Tulasnella sp. 418]|nr:hypothetical protein FRC02_003747 [Tulasnella sp. 418]
MADNNVLLNAFRARYPLLEARVSETVTNSLGDTTVIERVGDEVDEFAKAVRDVSDPSPTIVLCGLTKWMQHIHVFPAAEATIVETNLLLLQSEIRRAYESSLDASHNGHPVIIERRQTGKRGRPPIIIDSSFLRIAHTHHGATWLARYLGCSRSTVRRALLNYGIAAPCPNPFPLPPGPNEPRRQQSEAPRDDEHLPDMLPIRDPSSALEQETGASDHLDNILQDEPSTPSIHSRDLDQNILQSFTRPVSVWSDDELDDAVRRLRIHYPTSGLSMLHGSFRAMGHNVPRERLRQSLLRIDPVERVFGRLKIKRRTYSVPGPNSLWHHDGQHGLIRWGIVIHGFIDGYSRLITGLRASNNNRADTVLDLFLQATRDYCIPSRVRGDHGVENLRVAAFMELNKGVRRGSYIWGRSIHNIRIERLWVDVTAQFGHKWREFFMDLEIHHDLDVQNTNHKWLLHYLFLTDINKDASFFAEAWNHHKIKVKGGPSRSPAEMFFFDSLALGLRGDYLTAEQLREFGVDWSALDDDVLVVSNMANNPRDEGVTSWVGRVGPPEHLNEVRVDDPTLPLTVDQIEGLFVHVTPLLDLYDKPSLVARWNNGLAYARLCNNNF